MGGVFLIDFHEARRLTNAGKAEGDDFLLLVGCCAWGPRELQQEVDSLDAWTLVAADLRAFLGRIRETQVSLRARLDERPSSFVDELFQTVRENASSVSVSDLGNGVT